MRTPWTSETKNHIREYTISGIFIAIVCFALLNINYVWSFITTVWTSIAPFIWGFCIAFILLPMRRLCEEKWLVHLTLKPVTKRRLSVTVSLVVFFLIITAFFWILIPQLVSSFETLTASMDSYISKAESVVAEYSKKLQFDDLLVQVYNILEENIVNWVKGTGGMVTKVLSYSVTIVKGVFNFFVGIIIAVYLLIDQERWVRQIKKAFYAFFTIEQAESAFHVSRLTARMLNSFIFGKALDSLIIGLAAAVCCGLMNIPYTPLIAFVVGITNMIPVFGPFIGAIPCAFILLIISPAKALEFVIFILVLQQIDGNILGPYILGDSLGLPPIWVMFAIIVGGALWGVLGMFLGVPLFSVVYVLLKDHIQKLLREKRIKVT